MANATFLSKYLLLDYSNQGHLTELSTNLMEKNVNVYSVFQQIIVVIKLFITKTTDF